VPVVRLDHANASDSEWHEVNLDNAVAHGADLDGAIFRHTRLVNADFSGIDRAGARYLFCERTGAQLPPTPAHRVAPANDDTALAVLWPQWLTGHALGEGLRVFAGRALAGDGGGPTGRCGCGTWREGPRRTASKATREG